MSVIRETSVSPFGVLPLVRGVVAAGESGLVRPVVRPFGCDHVPRSPFFFFLDKGLLLLSLMI